MAAERTPSPDRRRPVASLVFWLSLCAFIPFASPTFLGDGREYLGQTERLVDNGDFRSLRLTPDGRFVEEFSRHPEGQPLATAPFYALSKLAAAALRATDEEREALAVFFVGLFNMLVGAAGLALLFGLAEDIAGRRLPALFIALLCGFGTYYGAYTKYNFAEPACATVALAVVALLRRFERQAALRTRAALWTGLAIGVGSFFRQEMLFLAAPAAAFFAWVAGRKAWPALGRLAAGVGLATVLHAVVQILKFGSLLRNPQDGAGFASALSATLVAQLFSASKGLIWYAPATLLTPLALATMARRERRLAAIVGGVAAFYLVFYSAWMMWPGDTSLGPRFAVIVTPLLILPLAALFRPDAPATGGLDAARAAALGLFLVGAGLTLLYGATDPLMIYDRGARLVGRAFFGSHYFFWKPLPSLVELARQGRFHLAFFGDGGGLRPAWRVGALLPCAIGFGAALWALRRRLPVEEKAAFARSCRRLAANRTARGFALLIPVLILALALSPSRRDQGLTATVASVCQAGDQVYPALRTVVWRETAFDAFNPLLLDRAAAGASCQDVRAILEGFVHIPSRGPARFDLVATGVATVEIGGEAPYRDARSADDEPLAGGARLVEGWQPMRIDFQRRSARPRFLLGATFADGLTYKEIFTAASLRRNLPEGRLARLEPAARRLAAAGLAGCLFALCFLAVKSCRESEESDAAPAAGPDD